MQDVVNQPRFDLTRFLLGHTKAWGLLEDRFGRVRRKFNVELHGSWSGDTFVLDETFCFDDGETERRTWRVALGEKGRFTANCQDCVGIASGSSDGDTVRMSYRFRLKYKGREIDIDFDDRIHKFEDHLALNRATMRKWGVKVGELWIAFVRSAETDSRPAAE